MSLNKADIDFAIFKSQQKCDANDADPANCDSVHRMLVSLSYYEQILKSDKDEQSFVAFIQNEWQNYLDDNIHLITAHSHQSLYDLFVNKYGGKACNINSCSCIHRQYRRSRCVEEIESDDAMFKLYRSIFDSTHCYILHLFELGLRFKQESDVNDKHKKDLAKPRNKLLDYFERIETTNKFMLKTGYVETGIEKTFLDDLFDFVFNEKVCDYLTAEQYDTEAIIDDIAIYSADDISNIFEQTNETAMQKISENAESYRYNEMSFSAGFVFWYWPYYAPKNQNETEEEKDFLKWGNVDDFGGYKSQDLYIERGKSNDFKTEILSYQNNSGEDCIQINDYNHIINKAKGYMQSAYCKGMKAKSTDTFAMRHYDIAPDSPIKIHHIISLSLYCDFTKLCTSFSATFRKLHQFETLQEVKQRNQNYYFISKYLREFVEMYGNSAQVWDNNEYKMKCDESGPFYSGMSTVMLVPAFSIRLNAPTSTTKQLAVAYTFAGDFGIIIQLNNTYYAGGREQRFLNTAWLSNFKSEDEMVTFGGSFPVQIQGIRDIAKQKRYDIFFEPLFRFDAIVSGLHLLDIDWNKQHIKILKAFINYANETRKKRESKFDDYILDTFKHYLACKTTLTFNLPLIDAYVPKEVKDLIFYSIDGVMDRSTTVYVDDYSNANIPRPEILSMFKKLEKLVIYSVDERGKTTYQISLKQLLRQINKIQCKITAIWKGKKDKKRSWLFYQDISSQIPKNVTLSLKSFIDYNKKCSDVLTIQSKSKSN